MASLSSEKRLEIVQSAGSIMRAIQSCAEHCTSTDEIELDVLLKAARALECRFSSMSLKARVEPDGEEVLAEVLYSSPALLA